MIVIGADVRKSRHALAAVDAGTGQLLGEREIPAKEQGHLEALRWAQTLGQEVVWAIEDLVILDPELTFGLPANLTAWTGMDALAHCIEAFLSGKATVNVALDTVHFVTLEQNIAKGITVLNDVLHPNGQVATRLPRREMGVGIWEFG